MLKTIVFFFFLALAIVGITAAANAQIIGKKMPVGVKSYTSTIQELDTISGKTVEYDIDFLDVEGVFDRYNFQDLDNSLKVEERVIVYDAKSDLWRLPLSYNEAFGVPDKKGHTMPRLWLVLGQVNETIRQKIK